MTKQEKLLELSLLRGKCSWSADKPRDVQKLVAQLVELLSKIINDEPETK